MENPIDNAQDSGSEPNPHLWGTPRQLPGSSRRIPGAACLREQPRPTPAAAPSHSAERARECRGEEEEEEEAICSGFTNER